MWLYCSVNENVWGYDELLSSRSFIGPPTSLWCWGSPRDRLNRAVNHETEPPSPTLSRLTVPACDMCFFIVVGEEKSCSAAKPAEVEAGCPLEPDFSGSVFPSVHLGGRGQTTALRGRWMEVVNRGWGQREQRREGVRERCMAAHIASDRMTDEGIMEQGYFPQWSKLGNLPEQAR